MPPMTEKPKTVAEALEQHYLRGGPSQFWKSQCKLCGWNFSGRSNRAVVDARVDHVQVVHHAKTCE